MSGHHTREDWIAAAKRYFEYHSDADSEFAQAEAAALAEHQAEEFGADVAQWQTPETSAHEAMTYWDEDQEA